MFFVGWLSIFVVAAAVSASVEASPRAIAAAGVALAAIAAVCGRRGHVRAAAALVACGCGAYVGARAVAPLILPPALAAVADEERAIPIEGVVTAAPEAVGAGARLRIAIERVGGDVVAANGALSVASGVPAALPGDSVRFVARVRSVRGLANPGVPDSSLQARGSGIDCFLGVGHADDIVRAPRPARGWLVPFRLAALARRALGRAIDRAACSGAPCAGPADAAVTGRERAAAALLHTAVLGERQSSDARVEDGFRAAGATHVLSVSGLHLAAVAFVFFVGLRRLLTLVPVLPLWLDPRRVAAALALPAVAFYTLLSGDAIATVRSAIMMTMGLLAVVLRRRVTSLVAVGVAVFVLLAWSPLALFDVSFQLSVVSVLALGLFAGPLAPRRARLPAPGRTRLRALGGRVLDVVGRLGAATVAAGATTAPLCAHHFGEVTPAAPLGNLLLVPLVEMAVVPFGLGGATLAAALGDGWGRPFLFVARVAAALALAIADRFRALAPVWTTRAPNALETTCLVLGVGLLLAAVGRGVARRRGKAVGAALALGVGVGSLAARELARRLDPDVIVTFLDVGQGDAAVVQAPGGRTLLIDGGGTYDGGFDPGARVVEPFLRARGITRLDAVVLSHPHPDHLNGLHRVVARFPVAALWTSGDDGHNPEYGRLLDEARARGVRLPVPSAADFGPLRVEPLGPFVAANGVETVGPPEGTSVNDASLVIRLVFGARSFLFAGDIEADGEGEVAGRRGAGQTTASDVLKVPHHGSRTSSSDELLSAVQPRLAVMSLGWKNRFHFPSAQVVARYLARGTALLRTDLAGAVTVRASPSGSLTTTCARGCR